MSAAIRLHRSINTPQVENALGATVGFLGGLLFVAVAALAAGGGALHGGAGVATLWFSALPLATIFGIKHFSSRPPARAVLSGLRYTALALELFFLMYFLSLPFAAVLGIAPGILAGLWAFLASSAAGVAHARLDKQGAEKQDRKAQLVDWNARYEEATARLARISVQVRHDREREESRLADFERRLRGSEVVFDDFETAEDDCEEQTAVRAPVAA